MINWNSQRRRYGQAGIVSSFSGKTYTLTVIVELAGPKVVFPGSILGPKTLLTPDGGFATKLWNRAAVTILHGTALAASEDHDNAVIPQEAEFDCVGFAYQDIGSGRAGWVVTSGVAEALLKDGTTAVRGYWAKAADTDGRIVVTTAPAGLEAISTSEHFREVGHCLESKDAGTNVLVKLLLHFL